VTQEPASRRRSAIPGRAAELLTVVLLVSFVTFMVSDRLPGNPAVMILGPHHSPEEYAAEGHRLGLDDPFLTRYWHWLSNAAHGDFGISLVPPRLPVSTLITNALPVSLELCLLAMVISVAIAIPAALWAVRRPGGLADRAIGAVSYALLSMPEFLVGLLLILLFVVTLHSMPRIGWSPITGPDGPLENLRHALLPALALALPQAALFAQVLRNDLDRTLKEDFVLAARATGERPARILVQSALRPSLFSFLTVAGVSVGYLMSGTVVVEILFGLPGLGRLLVKAAGGSDIPVVAAIVVLMAVVYVMANALIDVCYRVLDPRIRRGSHG
jgi:peptide/nickel transport system permease protein